MARLNLAKTHEFYIVENDTSNGVVIELSNKHGLQRQSIKLQILAISLQDSIVYFIRMIMSCNSFPNSFNASNEKGENNTDELSQGIQHFKSPIGQVQPR